MTRLRSYSIVATLFAFGCVAPTPPETPDLSRRAVAAPPPPTGAAVAPAAPPRQTTAEVEMSGSVLRPKGVHGHVRVWAENGPCFQPGSLAYGEGEANPDRWFIEVFVTQGSPIWLCAALSDGKDAYKLYGQAERSPVIGRGQGEVTYGELKIPLKKGPKISPPLGIHH